MSLIKLAFQQPIIVVNNQNDTSSSRTFSGKNLGAAAIGGTAGFAVNEGIKHLPKFNDKLISHRYGARMGSILGGFAGAASAYALIKNEKQEQHPNFYMM